MQFGFEFHMASPYWLSWWSNLLSFFLTPCPIVAEHVIIALSATLLLYNVMLWVRFLRYEWLSKVFFFILREFMNNQQGIPPSRNIFQISLKLSISHFLIYKFLPTSLWKTALMNITLLGPASWSLQLQPQQWKRTICFSLHTNSCTALVHLPKDHPVQISSNGFGNTISTLYRDSLLSFQMRKHFLTLLNTGFEESRINYTWTILVKKLPWTPSPPGWVCVCTFSKEVKPVLGLCAFHMTNIWLVLKKKFTMRSSFTCTSTFTFTPPWDFVSSILLGCSNYTKQGVGVWLRSLQPAKTLLKS